MTSPRLEPFQHIGARNLASNYHHLLADVPGLGKTAQLIKAADLVNATHVLVTCPASVRTHWREETEKWLGRVPAGWEFISYDQSLSFCKHPTRSSYDVYIPDEAQYVKTCDAQRMRAAFGDEYGLARRARYIWPSTGTPVLNRPRELWPVLKALHPHFSSWTFPKFAQRYCGAYWDGREFNTRGASRIDELASLLGPSFMTRRTKKQVYPSSYVEPIVELAPVEITREEMAEVIAEEQTILNRETYLSPMSEKFGQLGDLSRLLRLTGLAKVRAVASAVAEKLGRGGVPKIVVFYHHTEVGQRFADTLRAQGYGSVLYRGGMNDTQKDAAIKAFVHPDGYRIFIGQLDASGTGVDGLQYAASECAFLEQDWVPGKMGQGVSRLDRMGQAAKVVRATVYHAPGTMESAVYGSRGVKEKVIERLMQDEGRYSLEGPSEIEKVQNQNEADVFKARTS